MGRGLCWIGYSMVGLVISSAALAQPKPAIPLQLKIAPQISNHAPDHWYVDQRAWRYQSTSNVRFTVGNSTPQLVSGLKTVPLGGLSFSDRVDAVLTDKEQWRYGLALGVVDKQPTATNFNYGAKAARAWVDVRLSPKLSFDGLYQRAEGYEQVGLGSRYHLSSTGGVWAMSLTQSHHRAGKGWRYQGRYDMDISETVDVSLSTETYSGAFSNLLQSQNKSFTTPQAKHGVDVHWDTGRWGALGASYSSTQPRLGQNQHSFGVNQQFWYSSNLRIDLDAQRQIHTGDYNMGLRFSLPVF